MPVLACRGREAFLSPEAHAIFRSVFAEPSHTAGQRV